MNEDTQAWIIKIAAVVTAMPRWVAALLAAEGMVIPESWWWWLPLSAVMSAGMAIVEGWAFAFVFHAWRNAQGRASRWLAILAIVSAVVFVAVVAPYVAASVRGVAIGDILATALSLGVWSSAVALSTIAIVASVGFAQKRQPATRSETPANQKRTEATSSDPRAKPERTKIAECPWCNGEMHEPFRSVNQRNAHVGRCKMKVNGNGHKKDGVAV